MNSIIKNNIENSDLHYWAEVSGAIEYYFKKHNGYPTPNTLASEILDINASELTLLNDFVHYERPIGLNKGIFTKMIFGINSKYNYIDTDGNLLRDDSWFDLASDFEDGFAKVHLNYRRYYINTNGNLYDLDKNPIENVTENRRRVVRLTESQLRKTIERVVAQYLNESRRR